MGRFESGCKKRKWLMKQNVLRRGDESRRYEDEVVGDG